jgi:hypothetical protein
MDFQIMRGYIIIDSGKTGPLYVAPHAAPAYYKPGDHQDHNTHYIAYALAKDGGKALISGLSREQNIGIDFFRPWPHSKTALEAFDSLTRGSYRDRKKYTSKFAWVAEDIEEHAVKMEIYTKFWGVIRNHDGPIVFVHRKFFNPIRHPSVMDVIPYNRKEIFRKSVDRINRKYRTVLDRMFPVYRAGFEFKALCVDFKEEMAKSRLRLYHGRKPNIKRRRERFKKAMEEEPELKVTLMRNFKGRPMKLLMKQHGIKTGHPVFQAEISEFVARRFPDISVFMIRDIMKDVSKGG